VDFSVNFGICAKAQHPALRGGAKAPGSHSEPARPPHIRRKSARAKAPAELLPDEKDA